MVHMTSDSKRGPKRPYSFPDREPLSHADLQHLSDVFEEYRRVRGVLHATFDRLGFKPPQFDGPQSVRTNGPVDAESIEVASNMSELGQVLSNQIHYALYETFGPEAIGAVELDIESIPEALRSADRPRSIRIKIGCVFDPDRSGP